MRSFVIFLFSAAVQAASITYASGNVDIFTGASGSVTVTESAGEIVPLWTGEFVAGNLANCEHPGTSESLCRYLFKTTFSIDGVPAWDASLLVNETVTGSAHTLTFNIGTNMLNPELLFVFGDPLIATRASVGQFLEIGTFQTGQAVSFTVPLTFSPAFTVPEPSTVLLMAAGLGMVAARKRLSRH